VQSAQVYFRNVVEAYSIAEWSTTREPRPICRGELGSLYVTRPGPAQSRSVTLRALAGQLLQQAFGGSARSLLQSALAGRRVKAPCGMQAPATRSPRAGEADG